MFACIVCHAQMCWERNSAKSKKSILLSISTWTWGREGDLTPDIPVQYRVRHSLTNLDWFDFNSGSSIILPTCSATSANFPSAQTELGRGCNSTNQSSATFANRWTLYWSDADSFILSTGWPISWRTLVGLTLFWDVPPPCLGSM